MTKRSLLIAAAVAALMSFGSAAQAAFTITTTVNAPTGGTPTGLTFTPNTLNFTSDASTKTSFNYLDITYTTSTRNVGPLSFTLTGSLAVNTSSGASGTANFTATFAYNVDATGFGSLVISNYSLSPLTVAGVTFTELGFAAPTISPNATTPTTTGNLSVNVQQGAVPEPASIAMVGLGLAGLGGLALRRRSAK